MTYAVLERTTGTKDCYARAHCTTLYRRKMHQVHGRQRIIYRYQCVKIRVQFGIDFVYEGEPGYGKTRRRCRSASDGEIFWVIVSALVACLSGKPRWMSTPKNVSRSYPHPGRQSTFYIPVGSQALDDLIGHLHRLVFE